MKIRRIMLLTLLALLWIVSTAGCAAPSVNLKTVRTDHFQVQLGLNQGQTQSDEVTVDVKDLQGNVITPDSVSILSSMPAMGHSLPDVVAMGDGQGRYRANVLLNSMKGEWQLDIRITQNTITDIASFAVMIR